jgi:RNA polymerase sigma-70 factor (ECF subfamily)
MSDGPGKGLALIDALGASGQLDNYHLFHAARADLLRRMNRNSEAITAYQNALALTSNQVEADYLRRRIAQLRSLAV